MENQQRDIDGLYQNPEWLEDRRRKEFPNREDMVLFYEFIKKHPFIRKALELGSGTGYVSKRLAEQFYDRPLKITGLEYLQKYIYYAVMQAKKDGLEDRLEYIQGNMKKYDFNKGEYDLVFSIWSSFCQIENHEQQRLLNRFGALLNPNQVLYIDVTDWDNTPEYEERLDDETERLLKTKDGDCLLIWNRDDGSNPIFYFHSKELWEDMFKEAKLEIDIRPYNTSGEFNKYTNRMVIIGRKLESK